MTPSMHLALPSLDLMTLMRLCALLALPFGVGMAALAFGLRRDRAALLHWAAFNLLLFAGLTLATLRGAIADTISYVLADAGLLLAFVLWRRGNRLFLGIAARDRGGFALVALCAAVLYGIGFPQQNLKLGGVAIYGMLTWVSLQGSYELARALGQAFHWVPRTLTAVPTAAFGAFSLAKMLLIALVPSEVPLNTLVLMEVPRALNIAYVLMSFFGIIGVNIAFAFLLVIRLYGDVDRFHYLAQHDALTSLFNRRKLNEELAREAARHGRSGQPFALLMLDVDHFKRYNDSHGHQAGDAALRLLAGVLTRAARREDLVARIGGEEFCVLLPQTGLDEAARVGERIRAAVAATPDAASGGALTVSLGVAEHGVGEEPAHLIERADQALYRAKQGGRNRIERAA